MTRRVAHTVGTPRFLLVQGIVIVVWMSVNSRWSPFPIFDPYPFQRLWRVLAFQGVVLLLFAVLNRRRLTRLRRRLLEHSGER
jgi:uncharacterized membrane protein